jgi:hypothetical protein
VTVTTPTADGLRRARPRLVTAGVAIAVSFAAAAPAAAQEVPRSNSELGPTIGATAAGEVLMVSGDRSVDVRVSRPGSTSFGPAQRLAARGYSGTLAVGPAGHAVVLWNDGGVDGPWIAAFRAPGEAFGPSEVLVPSGPVGEVGPVAGFDAEGTATIAWPEDDGLLVRTRSAQGAWTPAARLAVRRPFRPRLHVRADGGATLAWEGAGPRTNTSQAVVSERSPGGAFGRPQTVAGVQRGPGDVTLAGNDRGDAGVAWVEFRDEPQGPRFSVHAAFRPAGGRFGRPVRVTGLDREASTPSLSIGPDGRSVIAFADQQRRRLYARTRSASGALLPLRTVSRDFEQNTDPVALARGAGLVAWFDRDPGRTTLFTAAAAADGRFGTPRPVASARDYIGFDTPALFATLDGLVATDPKRRRVLRLAG